MFGLVPFARDGRLDRWEDVRGENSLFRLFDEFERNFWNNSVANVSQFRTDIVDQGNQYLLSAELPGFAKEDIQVSLDGDSLVIRATHKEENEEKKDNYVRRERRCGSFSRNFDISGIQSDAIRASYENGVLHLELPKKDVQQDSPNRQIPIQ